MKSMQRFPISAVTAAMLLGLGGCAGMSAQHKNTSSAAKSVNDDRRAMRQTCLGCAP
jgi:hypothetical protein